jgi:hypothetical protein
LKFITHLSDLERTVLQAAKRDQHHGMLKGPHVARVVLAALGGFMTERHIDRFLDFVDAWSKPIAIWAMIFAALYFSPAIVRIFLG